MRRLAAILFLLLGGGASAGELELSHGQDALDHGLPSWRETALRAEWIAADAPGGTVTVREVERFDRQDWDLAASAWTPVGSRWTFGVEGSGSTTHRVLPMWSGGGRARFALGGGFAAFTGVRWAHYEDGPVSATPTIGHGGLEYYRGAHRLAWTTFVSRVEGSTSASHALAWDFFYRTRDRAGVVLSAGRELESLGGGRVLATDVLSAALLGRTAVGARWSVTYGVEVQRQGDLYTRSGGRLGLRRDF